MEKTNSRTRPFFFICTFLGFLLILLSRICVCSAAESDFYCLKSIKDSLQDPCNSLGSWDFSNVTEGFICQFRGIECWHDYENKVMNIRLSDSGLVGSYKQDIYCFGVVLLKLVTGKEPHELTSSRNLFDHSPCLLDADRDLLGKGADDLILQFLELACDCVKFFPNERPTMLEVYDRLKNISQGRRDWIQKIPLSADISSKYD
ncbi:hypothetical protein KY284_009744 [Solanum tuberosum]|nr:hypothetical protein KY284_009744 [Solanum tuberosum]